MSIHPTTRRLALVLLALASFLSKRSYHGPGVEWVHRFGGNFSVSFATYYLAAMAASSFGFGKLPAAAATLVAVSLFELTDGFGVMANVYDSLDLIANAVGIAVALALDGILERAAARPAAR